MVTFSPFFTTGRTGWKLDVAFTATVEVAAVNVELLIGPTIFEVELTAKVFVLVVIPDFVADGDGVGVGVAVTTGVGVGEGVADGVGVGVGTGGGVGATVTVVVSTTGVGVKLTLPPPPKDPPPPELLFDELLFDELLLLEDAAVIEKVRDTLVAAA
jgi:hypothetical protein